MKMGKINIVSLATSPLNDRLGTIHHAPSQLWHIGDLPKNLPPAVAIIGTRQPTDYGRHVTQLLAHGLAKAGVTIVSGLAYGVDACAHQAAIDAGGKTIAVLAGGLHRIYPRSHEQLAKDIVASGGTLISEHPPGFEAKRYDFLKRNRLISALSDVVLVTEATERSGTFSTVAHAIEQHKDIAAVPGPITSLFSAGCHTLLSQGAHFTTSPNDILQLLGIDPQKSLPEVRADTPQQQQILTLIREGVHDAELLQQKTKLDTPEFLQQLTILQLQGHISHSGANYWHLTS